MTPADQAQVLAAIKAQTAATGPLFTHATTAVQAQVADFTNWYDDTAVAAFAAETAARVQAVQHVAAAITDAHAQHVLTLIAPQAVSRRPSTIGVTALRKGVTLPDAYQRLAVAYRYQVAEGKSPEKALKLVKDRGTSMASTDVQLAIRAQWQQFLETNRIDSYRRVLHPELSVGGTCGLCIAASQRIYHRSILEPIHDGCHCGVIPVIGGQDYGLNLNEDDLKTLYADAGSTSADDLKRTQYVIHQHGELGPILGHKDDGWRGPADVAAA